MPTRKEIVIDNCMKCIRQYHKLTPGEQKFISDMLKVNNKRQLTTQEFNRLHILANPQGKDESQILYTK